MSAHADTERSIAELRDMNEATAKRELSMVEYQRWESLNQHLDEADDARQDLAEADAEVHDLLVNSDPTDLAADVTVWGNALQVYYGPEDASIRQAAERLADTFDVDVDGDLDAQADELGDDDIREEDLDDAKAALADLVTAAIVTWDGRRWADLSLPEREHIRDTITAPRPEGWGIAGLIDAWVEIQHAVETNRDARLERIQKFRDETRRGNR